MKGGSLFLSQVRFAEELIKAWAPPPTLQTQQQQQRELLLLAAAATTTLLGDERTASLDWRGHPVYPDDNVDSTVRFYMHTIPNIRSGFHSREFRGILDLMLHSY